MDALLVEGDEIELTPDPPWQWVAGRVTVKLSALMPHKTKCDGKQTLVEADIVGSGPMAASQAPQYMAPGFPVPGTLATLMLVVTQPTLSGTVKDLAQAVGTVKTTGTFTAMMIPAMNPASGAPDVPVKTGTWKVATEKQSLAKSSQPSSDAQDGDSGSGGGSSAGGSNSASNDEEEGKLHYVAVTLEDQEGNALSAHSIVIHNPDGKSHARTTTPGGAARVDSIAATGTAIITLLGAPAEAPIKSDSHWIAVEIVDENGAARANAELEITLPNGKQIVRKTSRKGVLLIGALEAAAGPCRIAVSKPGEPARS